SVALTWIVSQIFLVSCMHLTYPKLRRWTQKKSLWTLPVIKNAKPAFIILLVSTIGFAIAGKDITFSTRLFDDLPANEPSRVITENIDKTFGGILAYELVLESTNPAEFRQFEVMNKV